MCMQLIKSAELTVTKFEIVTLVCGSTKITENIGINNCRCVLSRYGTPTLEKAHIDYL